MDYRLRHVTQAIYCNGLIVRLLGFKCWRPVWLCALEKDRLRR